MAAFPGFPARGATVPVPAALFSDLLPVITDSAELKVTLHVLWRISERRVVPRFVRLSELDVDRVVLAGLASPPLVELRRALNLAVARGSLLEVAVRRDSRDDRLFFLNNDANRRTIVRLETRDLDLGQSAARLVPRHVEVLRPNVFALYEQNIGLLTPLIADELRSAEHDYPADWFEDAFRIAVAANRRSWRYISRILERWQAEGKDDGTVGADSSRDSWDRYFGPGGRAPG